jgi:hypothetical protein
MTAAVVSTMSMLLCIGLMPRPKLHLVTNGAGQQTRNKIDARPEQNQKSRVIKKTKQGSFPHLRNKSTLGLD